MAMTVNGLRAESTVFTVPVNMGTLRRELTNNLLPSINTKNVGRLDGIQENDLEILAEGWVIGGRYNKWCIHVYANEIEENLCEVELVAMGHKLFNVVMSFGNGRAVALSRSITKRDELAQAIRRLG